VRLRYTFSSFLYTSFIDAFAKGTRFLSDKSIGRCTAISKTIKRAVAFKQARNLLRVHATESTVWPADRCVFDQV